MFTRCFAFCAALLLGSFSHAAGASPQTSRITVLINGRVAGNEVETINADGRIAATFQFNDRGRGPKVVANYVLAPNGFPSRLDITGNDYLKAPVDEHLSVENGVARWKSTSEHGESRESAFYVSNNGPPSEAAMLAAALLKSKNAEIKLFPAGEARLERMSDLTVSSQGKRLHVTEYGLTGLDFQPQTVWLDDDQQFFAIPGKWFAFVREGWENANDQLYAVDRSAEDARSARLARDLARHLNHPLAVEHVRLFNSEQAVAREDQTVLIEGNHITAVGPSPYISVPQGAEHIDGRGKTLVPGLFDMHAHLAAVNGPQNIASGVTSARDMGNDIDELKHLEDQWNSGTAIGPRVWKAGFIDGHDPMQAPTGLYADSVEEARAAVNRYADLGYVQIKLYSSLHTDLVPDIVKTAHSRGLRVSGHVPNGMTATQFVEDGVDEIQHINFIFLNFFASKVKDTRTPERFTAVGDYAAKLDLHSTQVNDFIELLKEHHTVVDVTLATFEPMFTGRPGQVSPDLAPVLNRLPAQIQRSAYTGGLAVTSENDQLYKDSYEAMLRMTKRLYDEGIPILAGTDATPGIMLHRELELEVRAGIPAAKALQIATSNAAQLLKQNDLGVIAPGKLADFVLVDGNPVENISDIRRCRLVMKDGVLYNSADVYRAVGIEPAP